MIKKSKLNEGHSKLTSARKLIMLAAVALIAILLAGCGNSTPNSNADLPSTSGVTNNDLPSYPNEDNNTPENDGGMVIELLNFIEALEILTEGAEADVLDIETGITYRVRRVTGGYNTIADVETLTPEDTNNLLETAGGNWNVLRRAVIVTVDGRHIAASILPFPHSGSEDHPFGAIIDNRSGATGTGVNLDSIRGNEMIGVVDIFFFNSLTPGINRVDERHQEMVMRAYDYER